MMREVGIDIGGTFTDFVMIDENGTLAVGKVATETGPAAGALGGLSHLLDREAVVTAGRVNAFIATLSSSLIFRGFALVATGGALVTVSGSGFQFLGSEELVGIKVSVYVFAAFELVCGFILMFTSFGSYLYAVGGNPEAARLSGIRVSAVKVASFAISGLAAGLGGVIGASRVSTGQADAGALLEFTAIAAIVIGGTSIYGGEGAIWRTILGLFLLAMIGNGFNLLDIAITYQLVVQGVIIAFAVGLDGWTRG